MSLLNCFVVIQLSESFDASATAPGGGEVLLKFATLALGIEHDDPATAAVQLSLVITTEDQQGEERARANPDLV